jgi:hypothetical protein
VCGGKGSMLMNPSWAGNLIGWQPFPAELLAREAGPVIAAVSAQARILESVALALVLDVAAVLVDLLFLHRPVATRPARLVAFAIDRTAPANTKAR